MRNLLEDSDPPPLKNDLQGVVTREISAVQSSLRLLADLPGSLAVSMSGSGPSCFALFADVASAQAALQLQQPAFAAAGLSSWCCAFRSEGIKLEA